MIGFSRLSRLRQFRVLAVLGAAMAFSGIISSDAFARGDKQGSPGEFDYYTLSLSWSPTFCDGGGNRRDDDQQCSGGRPYAFILHGLWPQYQRDWPEFCRTRDKPWVPQNVIDSMLDIMPSKQLIIHEYRKHGTCSGLEPGAYFDTARRAYDSVHIPERFRSLSQPLTVTVEDVIGAFVKANPQLQPDMIGVSCTRNKLQEVRVCLSKDLKPQSCGQNEKGARQCEGRSLTMPPMRGGGDDGSSQGGRDRGI